MTRKEHIEHLITTQFDELDETPATIRREFFEMLDHCGYIIPESEPNRPARRGFMCSVDFDCELGAAEGGNMVYPSVENLKERRRCVQSCGITEVEVREVRIVQEADYEYEAVAGKDDVSST